MKLCDSVSQGVFLSFAIAKALLEPITVELCRTEETASKRILLVVWWYGVFSTLHFILLTDSL